MIDLDRHIRHLLRHHDCVTLPGFGAFIARYYPASYSADLQAFRPPFRSASFNSELTFDDALLTASVSRSRGVSHESARRMIDEALAYVSRSLDAQGEHHFEGIGILRRDADGMLDFRPDPACAANDLYASLPVVTRLAVLDRSAGNAAQAAVEAARENAADTEPSSVSAGRGRRWPAWSRIAGAAASVAIVGSLLWSVLTFLPVDSTDAHRESAAMAPASTLITDNISRTQELYIAIPRDREAENSAPVAAPASEAETTARATAVIPDKPAAKADNAIVTAAPEQKIAETGEHSGRQGRYCIVVASLPTRALAQKHIRSLGSADGLHILESDGRFRVYAATAETQAEAAAKRQQLLDRYPDAWVCRR